MIHPRFKVSIGYNKTDYETYACVLKSILEEKGFKTQLVYSELQGNFISSEFKEIVRSSICLILITDAEIINSSAINQGIGYAQGKGLNLILLTNTDLENKFVDIPKQITVMRFNEDSFKKQCFSIVTKIEQISEIMEEPIDVDAFLDLYARTKI